jgi:hypothetical protein
MKCKPGYYYCHTDKKCKSIPKGLRVTGKYFGNGKEPTEVANGTPVEGGEDSNGNGNGNGGSMSEEGLRDWFGKSKSKDGKGGWVNVKTGGTCASDEPGEGTPKCVSSTKRASMTKAERDSASRRKKAADPGQQSKSGAAKPTYVSTDPKKKMKNEEVEVTEAKDKKGKSSGKKDACYHKVKSRYSVWPSAYASGALVKCRKKGAANWGNKSEETALENKSDHKCSHTKKGKDCSVHGKDMCPGLEKAVSEAKKCWPGYEKKGTKKMFGKTYNNCVKKEDIELTDAYGNTFATIADIVKPEPLKSNAPDIESYETYDIEAMTEAVRIPAKTGNIILVTLSWRGKFYMIKMFFPQISKPSRSDVQLQIDKVYPGAKVNSYYISDVKPGEHFLQTEGAAWTKSSGKNKEGGLNEKGRKSYERENPGSDLKAPSKKKGNKRRASFCARMKGMKKKLTSAKTASDPDSRINKSLRAWNC